MRGIVATWMAITLVVIVLTILFVILTLPIITEFITNLSKGGQNIFCNSIPFMKC